MCDAVARETGGGGPRREQRVGLPKGAGRVGEELLAEEISHVTLKGL